MNYFEKEVKEVEIIKKYGGYDIKHYTLINNYGYTFKIGKLSFDARHWLNCYGVDVNYWTCNVTNINSTEYAENRKAIRDELESLTLE